jgi:hypothetical protein
MKDTILGKTEHLLFDGSQALCAQCCEYSMNVQV